jgi:hypothetical protein
MAFGQANYLFEPVWYRCKLGFTLREERQLLEARAFWKIEHKIEVLNGLSRRPLHQIVDCRNDNRAPWNTVGMNAKHTVVRSAHELR